MIDTATGAPEASTEAESVPSEDIVQAVAVREGADPVTLDPLYEAIDPDALDAVVDSGAVVSFEYEGYEITVDEGTITIE
ncbi:HalOD1 output domain-containing protein [Halomicrobium urmianum]|uniref:HalOD1 output domain-containing protein n=1 Tax=Halomicrobium urmianum TaxID=1586233 RepID=UPI001CD96D4C|nr:HalOD1 output domain-containing protein [Halomicrobium urmianum]